MTERERNAKVAQVLRKAIETEKAIARQARECGARPRPSLPVRRVRQPQNIELSHDGKAEGMKYALGLLQDDYYLDKQHDWFYADAGPAAPIKG